MKCAKIHTNSQVSLKKFCLQSNEAIRSILDDLKQFCYEATLNYYNKWMFLMELARQQL